MKLSTFKMDNEKVNGGTWVTVAEGLELLIARVGNEKYKKFLRSAGKGLAMQVRVGQLDTEQAADLQRLAVANTVLLGWKNLTEDDGTTPIEYSPGKALEIFKSHPDFYDLVVEFASDAANFREAVKEDARGN